MSWNGGGELLCLILIFLLWHEKKHETPRQDNRYPALDSNRVPPECRCVKSLGGCQTRSFNLSKQKINHVTVKMYIWQYSKFQLFCSTQKRNEMSMLRCTLTGVIAYLRFVVSQTRQGSDCVMMIDNITNTYTKKLVICRSVSPISCDIRNFAMNNLITNIIKISIIIIFRDLPHWTLRFLCRTVHFGFIGYSPYSTIISCFMISYFNIS